VPPFRIGELHVKACGGGPELGTSTISPHFAEKQAARSAGRRALTRISGDAADEGALGRTGHHVFTGSGPLARSGDIAEHRAADSARCRALPCVFGDAADNGTPRRAVECVTTPEAVSAWIPAPQRYALALNCHSSPEPDSEAPAPAGAVVRAPAQSTGGTNNLLILRQNVIALTATRPSTCRVKVVIT